MKITSITTALGLFVLALQASPTTAPFHAETTETTIWSTSYPGTGELWRIQPIGPSPVLVGCLTLSDDAGRWPDQNVACWSTVAASHWDATLYFVRRGVPRCEVYKIDSSRVPPIAPDGTVPKLRSPLLIGTLPFGGNICGLCTGPDGQLYIAATQIESQHLLEDPDGFLYDGSVTNPVNAVSHPISNGLFRFYLLNGSNMGRIKFVGQFKHYSLGNPPSTSRCAFYADMDFNPKTSEFWGIGNDRQGRTGVYWLSNSVVLGINGMQDHDVPFDYSPVTTSPIAGCDQGLSFDKDGFLYVGRWGVGVFKVDPAHLETPAVQMAETAASGDMNKTGMNLAVAWRSIIQIKQKPPPTISLPPIEGPRHLVPGDPVEGKTTRNQ